MRLSDIAGKKVEEDAVGQPRALRQLEAVTLLSPVMSDEGTEVPAGSSGTIVHVWPSGTTCEVEFSKPFHALATVKMGDIAA